MSNNKKIILITFLLGSFISTININATQNYKQNQISDKQNNNIEIKNNSKKTTNENNIKQELIQIRKNFNKINNKINNRMNKICKNFEDITSNYKKVDVEKIKKYEDSISSFNSFIDYANTFGVTNNQQKPIDKISKNTINKISEFFDKSKDAKKLFLEKEKENIENMTNTEKNKFIKHSLMVYNDQLNEIEDNYKKVNFKKQDEYEKLLDDINRKLIEIKYLIYKQKNKKLDHIIAKTNEKIIEISLMIQSEKLKDIEEHYEKINLNKTNKQEESSINTTEQKIKELVYENSTIKSYEELLQECFDEVKKFEIVANSRTIENLFKRIYNTKECLETQKTEFEKNVHIILANFKANDNILEQIENNKNYRKEEIKTLEQTIYMNNLFLKTANKFANEEEKKIIACEMKKIEEINELIEDIKKEIENNIYKYKEDVDELKNKISFYNKILDDMKNISFKDKDVESKINNAEENLAPIKSFIESSIEFANEIQNEELKNNLNDLSYNFNKAQNNLSFSKQVIMDIEKKENLFNNCKRELKNIEDNYKNAALNSNLNLDEIQNYENALSEVKTGLKKIHINSIRTKNKEFKQKTEEMQKRVNKLLENIKKQKKEIELKNQTPLYNDVLDDVKKITHNDEKDKIDSAEENLALVKSFIESSIEFANENQNEELKNKIKNLSSNFEDAKHYLEFIKNNMEKTKKNTELIKNYDEKLKNIESNYENATTEQIENYENYLSEVKTNLEKVRIFAHRTKNQILKNKIEEIKTKIDNFKYEQKVNKLKNQISLYNKILDDVKKITHNDEKDKINSAEENLALVKSFIENSIEFTNENQNEKLKNNLNDLSSNFNKAQDNLSFSKQVIMDIEKKENLFNNYKKELKNIEDNYKNAALNSNLNLDEIQNYENALSEIKKNIKNINNFANKIKNKKLQTEIKNELKKIRNIYNLLKDHKKKFNNTIEEKNEKIPTTPENNI